MLPYPVNGANACGARECLPSTSGCLVVADGAGGLEPADRLARTDEARLAGRGDLVLLCIAHGVIELPSRWLFLDMSSQHRSRGLLSHLGEVLSLEARLAARISVFSQQA